MPTFIISHPSDALQRSSGSADVFKASIGAGDGRVLIFFLLGHSLPRSRLKKNNMIKLNPERIMVFQFQARLHNTLKLGHLQNCCTNFNCTVIDDHQMAICVREQLPFSYA
ncbi:hypothetical protein Tsp_06841 [Trichinella spiralis]|uniref:Uncharacterized protein n=1 Tax=Trichinella spiralis TaxID=6334 RepID=E5S686_TRISP|nr:hypothetical protein Tsp_06841 [Trichinella spiralis]KRY35308.1 hypothetical protein T01_4577 [Trichinella spiralis]